MLAVLEADLAAQAEVVKKAIDDTQAAWSRVPTDVDSDDQDARTVNDIDLIRTRALDLLCHCLS